jgi:predicted dithiol-disulfide oxidoreductase (DUF899 family)
VHNQLVSRDEWIQTRSALLNEEKATMRLLDQLGEKRRALPWLRIDKEYSFKATDGSVTLAGLFGSCSQLFVKHFMMGPGQPLQCVGCSLEADHVDGLLPHLENNDVSYVAIARAPIQEIERVRHRMGWKFNWVSSHESDFNYDFNVSFSPQEMAEERALYNFRRTNPGLEDLSGNSVFYKDEAGDIFLTYSSFGRGSEDFLGIYRYFDVVPKGRNENGPFRSLTDWARPHDMYGKGGKVEANGRYHPASCCEPHP